MTKPRITPIGTCRIHTPLRRGAARHPIEIDQRRNYGFVHTSDEALQLVRFLQGDKQFQPGVAPIVARDGDFRAYDSETWAPSDLHIVEISSAKRIASGNDSVQANYLAHHFADFFAHPKRARAFWSLVKRSHRQQLLNFLERQASYRLLSAEDRELLASLQMEPQSFKSIKSDMAEIVERLGSDKLLFVTHVNATTADGELIPTRDRLIRWVKMAAEQLGAQVFDPTAAMLDFGQDRALEAGGLDLTHYTPAFYDRVFEEIHRIAIVPLIGATGASEDGDTTEDKVARQAARLEAMLELGDFRDAARQIHAAVAKSPGALPLVELRGLVRSKIGDFPAAVADLTLRGDDTALSQAMRTGLVEALNATGDTAGALRVAESLIADEHESAATYKLAAEAAERLGKIDKAIPYAKQAFRQDRGDLTTALNALVLLAEHRSADEVATWRAEILENIGESATGTFEVSLWAIRNRDEELFAAVLKAIAALDKTGTIDLLEDAFSAGLNRAVARSVGIAAALGRLPRSLSARRQALFDGLLERARELLAAGKPDDAFEIAAGLLRLDEVSSRQIPVRKLTTDGRRLIRDMTKEVRGAIREAFKASDSDEVFRIAESAGDLLFAVPEGAAVYARSLHARGDTDDALAVMKKARAENPDNFTATRWTARLAAIAGDYLTAIEAYGALRRSSDPEAAKIESELDRFFATVEGRALKQLRRLIAEGAHEQALQLAQLLREEVGAEEVVDRELNRLHSQLRRRLKEIELVEGEPEEIESVLTLMLEVRPSDSRMLRRLALQLMQRFRYAEAAELWARVQRLEPDNDTAARQRERCTKMAARRVAAWGGELDAAA